MRAKRDMRSTSLSGRPVRRTVVAWRMLILICIVCPSSVSKADYLLVENFDAYNNNAALQAVWNEQADPVGRLDREFGNPGRSLRHSGGTTNNRVFAPTAPTDEIPLVWEFDFFDDGESNKRLTAGLRDDANGTALGAILEMGRYNAAEDLEAEEPGVLVSGYGVRTSLLGTAPIDWATFGDNPPVQIGWHHFRATIRASDVRFELDLGDDGNVDANRTILTSSGASKEYDVVRFGGPSNLSSTGGGANIDNLVIRTLTGDDPESGDMDIDGDIDFDDIPLLVEGLTNPGTYEASFGVPAFAGGDTDGDLDLDFDDIPGFVDLLRGTAQANFISVVPEPSGLILLLVGLMTACVARGTRRQGRRR